MQNFYRYVSGNLNDRKENSAVFRSLPKQHVLTVRLDTPESWNVQAIHAVQDPDNLRCDQVSCGDSPAKKDTSKIVYSLKVINISNIFIIIIIIIIIINLCLNIFFSLFFKHVVIILFEYFVNINININMIMIRVYWWVVNVFNQQLPLPLPMGAYLLMDCS